MIQRRKYWDYRVIFQPTIPRAIWEIDLSPIHKIFLLTKSRYSKGTWFTTNIDFLGFLLDDYVNEERWLVQFLLATCHDIPASIAASVLPGTERGRAIQFREKSMPGIRQPRDMAEAAKCLNARKPGLNAADCSRREMRGCTMDDDT